MPLFFFDVTDNGSVFTDREGTVCHNKVGAQAEAARALGSMARDALADGDGGDRLLSIAVRDVYGRSLVRVRLQYTVELDR
jgi:hypothetical protein